MRSKYSIRDKKTSVSLGLTTVSLGFQIYKIEIGNILLTDLILTGSQKSTCI